MNPTRQTGGKGLGKRARRCLPGTPWKHVLSPVRCYRVNEVPTTYIFHGMHPGNMWRVGTRVYIIISFDVIILLVNFFFSNLVCRRLGSGAASDWNTTSMIRHTLHIGGCTYTCKCNDLHVRMVTIWHACVPV